MMAIDVDQRQESRGVSVVARSLQAWAIQSRLA
jgi:hypothetical protein